MNTPRVSGRALWSSWFACGPSVCVLRTWSLSLLCPLDLGLVSGLQGAVSDVLRARSDDYGFKCSCDVYYCCQGLSNPGSPLFLCEIPYLQLKIPIIPEHSVPVFGSPADFLVLTVP